MPEVISLETATARMDYDMKLARQKRRGMTSAERQKEFKAKMTDAGFVQVHGWVHSHQAGDLKELIDRLKGDPDLDAGSPRSRSTGKLSRRR